MTIRIHLSALRCRTCQKTLYKKREALNAAQLGKCIAFDHDVIGEGEAYKPYGGD